MPDNTKEILSETGRYRKLIKTKLLDSPSEIAFDNLTYLASKMLKAPVSLVSLVDPNRQFFKSQIGLSEPWASKRETPLSHSFCQYVVASHEALIIEDARIDPLVAENLAIRDLDVISYLGIPLITDDGFCLGSFCVIDSRPRRWSEDDIDIMKKLAGSVMTEINLRLEVEAKEETLKQLQAKNEDLDAFAHSVSHNLKNSIGAIIGWASVGKNYRDRMSTDELQETLNKVADFATRTNDIINELLLLARINGKEDIQLQELNMFNIIDDALARLEHQITVRNVSIHLPSADTFPSSLGYRQWVEEIWMNYISNAIKYGGNPPSIEFGAEIESADFVRYWIKDNGKGIAPEDLDKLFIPFSRLATTATLEGHGLGLAIVLRIVAKLGGAVDVTSEVGTGSTFSFTLPRYTNSDSTYR